MNVIRKPVLQERPWFILPRQLLAYHIDTEHELIHEFEGHPKDAGHPSLAPKSEHQELKTIPSQVVIVDARQGMIMNLGDSNASNDRFSARNISVALSLEPSKESRTHNFDQLGRPNTDQPY